MQVLTLQTTIGEGQDKQIDMLFAGPGRKLVQITLRNGAVLGAHKAPVPITIQCVAGCGTLSAGGEEQTKLQLIPGTLVTLEPDIVHQIAAQPDVSILLTQFTG
jgi:quercetin dioxygenase-like cupin family protein